MSEIDITRRSSMTLYCDHNCVQSHRAKIVLTEKAVAADIIHVRPDDMPESLLEANPYGNVPTLVDRDLMINQVEIMCEYLDERFPHPPLLPVYPIARAKSRMMMHRIVKDWDPIVSRLMSGGKPQDVEKARTELYELLMTTLPIFSEMPYFLSSEFSMVDCYIAPILWRLPSFAIELPKSASAITEYSQRVFERETFKSCLSEIEMSIHETILDEL